MLVCVSGVSAHEPNEMKRKSVKEGESVTLEPGVPKNPNDVMTWYFHGTLMNEINGDPSKLCTDDQCDERFRDRLKLDHQTGSLTITNTRTTDSGLYHLEITSHTSSLSWSLHCHQREELPCWCHWWGVMAFGRKNSLKTSSHHTDRQQQTPHRVFSDQCVTPVSVCPISFCSLIM